MRIKISANLGFSNLLMLSFVLSALSPLEIDLRTIHIKICPLSSDGAVLILVLTVKVIVL